MATLTLQSGPGLLYSESLRDDGCESDTSVISRAHEYLFEELDRFGRPTLREIVLLVDGNPYLLAIYSRYNAEHLVTAARQLRAPPSAAEHLLLRRNEYGWLNLSVVSAQDADEYYDPIFGKRYSFVEAHDLRISYESSEGYRQPTLGELFDVIFRYFGGRNPRTSDDVIGEPGKFDDSEAYYAEMERLEAYDSERNDILAEMGSDQDDWERTQESGWHED